MKTKNLFSFISIFVSIICCKELADDEIGRISIFNNSNHHVYIYSSENYPDTSLYGITNKCEIQPHQYCEATSLHGWKGDIQSTSKGIIMFFVVDVDTIIKYNNDIWQKEYKILRRYELSQSDLEKSKWTITYP